MAAREGRAVIAYAVASLNFDSAVDCCAVFPDAGRRQFSAAKLFDRIGPRKDDRRLR